ncbi:MAG: hypothetical protein IJA69_02950 [Clostridia bacterium]|nr:hypothetical protein [Clostridia bacterium]
MDIVNLITQRVNSLCVPLAHIFGNGHGYRLFCGASLITGSWGQAGCQQLMFIQTEMEQFVV